MPIPNNIEVNETPTFQSGARVDQRSAEEKLKDYHFEEIVATANPVNWTEKSPTQWRQFPIFNQNGSGSCVAQTLAKLLGVLYWLKNQSYVHFSATHIYQRRANKPNGGMNGVDAFNIASQGVTLEELVPSQIMTDAQMDGVLIEQYKKDVGTVFKIPNYVSLPVKDIDTIASVIQTTGKAVMVWFYFDNSGEWIDIPEIHNVNLSLEASSTNRHSVSAVDFTLFQGKKAIIIEDSWGKFGSWNGQRVITEDFFKVRNWFAAYPIAFVFDDQSQPSPQPQYAFTKALELGQTSNDIKELQNILKYEGLFPTNTTSTGYYGAITAKAVLAWQKKHAVASVEELDSLQGRRVGSKTLAALNQIYA